MDTMPPPPLPFDRTNIKPGDRLCAAISGGADSVALLLTLHAANATPRESLGIGLSAVHIHHGLRGAEADADQHFVKSLCARLDIPLHLHHATVPDRVAETHETIEEAARAIRYEHFATLIATGQADTILTAHTLDDQAETVLMKLLRGAWTEGLSAIHPVVLVPATSTPGQRSGKILRPFLNTRRTEIEAFLTQSNQLWREDSTNTDTAFTRNRVRHELLPQLRTYNPNLDQALANLAELAREEEARWQTELSRILPQLLLPGKPVRGGGRAVSTTPGHSAVSIELDRLRSLDPALRRRVIRAAARQLGARLTFDETSRLLALCGFLPHPTVAARTGSTLHLSNNLRAERSPRELRLFLAQTTSPTLTP
jgi:tRNA(Ile)-lysidine synthase